MTEETSLWLAACALHLAMVLALLPRLEPTKRRDLGVAALLASLAAFAASHRLPLHLVTPIHEGFSLHHGSEALGVGGESGMLLTRFWAPLTGPTPVLLDSLVTANLALGLGAGFLLARAVVRLAADARAAVLVLALGLSPMGRHLLLSESAAAQVLLYSLALLPALRQPSGAGVLLGLLTILALAGTRLELGLLAAIALTAAWFNHRHPEWAAAWRERLERASAAQILLALAGASLALSGVMSGLPALGGRWAFLSEGLADSAFTWPSLWVATAAWGVPALVPLGILGWREALRQPGRYLTLLTIPWLFAVYLHAAHGDPFWGTRRVAPYELLRYLMLLTPALALLGALGWRSLTPRGRNLALLACLVPALPGTVALLRPHPSMGPIPAFGLLDTDAQRESRALLHRLRSAPSCPVLTIGQPWMTSPHRVPRWMLLDASVPDPRSLSTPWRPGDTVPDALQRLGHTGCVAIWRSVDCSTEGLADCEALRALQPEGLETWHHVRFTHPEHLNDWPETLEVGWLSLPP